MIFLLFYVISLVMLFLKQTKIKPHNYFLGGGFRDRLWFFCHYEKKLLTKNECIKMFIKK
jgi:hypothetical protein